MKLETLLKDKLQSNSTLKYKTLHYKKIQDFKKFLSLIYIYIYIYTYIYVYIHTYICVIS
jgi:hypothetical protein